MPPNPASHLNNVADIEGRIELIKAEVLEACLIVDCLKESVCRRRNLSVGEYDVILSQHEDHQIKTEYIREFTTIDDFTQQKAEEELRDAKRDLEKAEAKLKEAKEELEKAKEELEKAKVELSPSTLTAFLAAVEWDKVFERVDCTTMECMAGVIGYEYAGKTSPRCTNTNPCVMFASIMEGNWRSRTAVTIKNSVQKEQMAVCATFGAAGQGKTEFCRQMGKHLLSCKYDGIDWVVPLMISFNQTSPWSTQQESSDAQFAVIRRILKNLSFGNNQMVGTKLVDLDLAQVLAEIRISAATHFKVDACRVGIVLLVDELMKVDDSSRSEMLNTLAGRQQSDLESNLFTQFIVTSLDIAPVANEYVTKSNRPLDLIELPQLDSAARDRVFDSVRGFYREILQRRYAADKRLTVLHVLREELDVFLRTLINICGRHFRTLESALLALYVAITQDEAPTKETHPVGVWLQTQRCKNVEMAHQVLKKGAGRMRDTLSMRHLLKTVACTDPAPLDAAVCVFQNVLFEPSYDVAEADSLTGGVKVQDLIGMGIVYNHGKMENIKRFRPRVSLPYLFTQCMVRLLPDKSIGGNKEVLAKLAMEASDKEVLAKLAEKASDVQLSDEVESFVVAIARLGVVLSMDRMRGNGGSIGAQDGFEYAVADLHYLRHCRRTDSCAINNLFEDSEVEGWGDDESNANLQINVPPDYVYEVAQEECPSPGMPKSMCVRQSGKDWTGIECVVNLWKRGDLVLPLLFSNKLRETSPNGKIAEEAANSAHKAAGKSGYKPGEYYVVVFTCDRDVPTKKCKGTIYVPLSGVTAMLEPVGGTCLYNIVQLKGSQPLQ